MARVIPLQREQVKDLKAVFEITEAVMGFVPNSMLIMARDPDLLAAFAQLSAVVMVRPGKLDPGLKSLIMYAVSRPSGCQYCMAHSALLATSHGIASHKVEEACRFESSREFGEAERTALRFAQSAGQTPNAVSDAEFEELRRHFSEDEILEIVSVIAFMGFLNRWNDTLATPLENAPRSFGERHLSISGWSVGKHTPITIKETPRRWAASLRTRVFRRLLKIFGPKSVKF
jgi:uncharacterized peroxidase-related enzyme